LQFPEIVVLRRNNESCAALWFLCKRSMPGDCGRPRFDEELTGLGAERVGPPQILTVLI
jgi:hypothetical protein